MMKRMMQSRIDIGLGIIMLHVILNSDTLFGSQI